MTTDASSIAKTDFFCSFCKKSEKQIRFLIAGPPLGEQTIYICNECVDKCNEIIHKEVQQLAQSATPHESAREEAEGLADSGSVSD